MIDRRTFLRLVAAVPLATALPASALAMGPDDRFTVGILRYTGNWNPRPTALRRLMLEVEKRTSIEVAQKVPELDPTSDAIFEHPFITLAGDRKFEPLPEDAILELRTYLQSGGFLYVDSAEGVQDGPFMQSVKRELQRIYGDDRVVAVPRDHVLYKSFYLIDQPVGRVVVAPRMEGVFDDDRLAVVISHNDTLGAWARDNFGRWEFECTPGGERQREFAYRLGINLVMYALCINYKADQVHVPFILRRRKWKVE